MDEIGKNFSIALVWYQIWKKANYETPNALTDGKELKPGAKTKAGKRVIQLMDETLDELLSHKKKVQSDKREAGELYNDLDLVVCTSLGTPVNPSNLRRSFNRQIKKPIWKDSLSWFTAQPCYDVVTIEHQSKGYIRTTRIRQLESPWVHIPMY